MTLLTICQNVGYEIGVTVPSTIAGNSDKTAKLLLALANRSGTNLMKGYDWRVLRTEQTYTTSGSTSSLAISTVFSSGDFDRMVNDTEWDRTGKLPLALVDPVQWQTLQGGFTSNASIQYSYIQRGSSLLFSPDVPDAT